MPEEIKVIVVSYPDRKYLVLRYRDPFSGRFVTKSSNTTNRRDAEKAAAKWESQLQEGRYQRPVATSWEAFRDRYENEVLTGLATRTQAMVRTVFNSMEKILRPQKIRDLTASRLSFWQSQLRDKGRAEETIRSYSAHLKAALGWAVDVGFLQEAPKLRRPPRAKGAKMMKGRPITAEEFERILTKTGAVVGAESESSWRYFLEGLWLSGLRIAESLDVFWDRQDRLCVDLSLKRPMLRIPAELEKGNKDRLLPLAPDFAQFLLQTTPPKRRGRVFRPAGLRMKGDVVDEDWASRVIARIGKLANVKVHVHPTSGKVKYASAHDLRRSFGERWSRKVMPQVLKELMRHESIETTMKYYVGYNAQLTAESLWAAFEQGQDKSSNPPSAALVDGSNQDTG